MLTRDKARHLITHLMRSQGTRSEGLNERGLGGMALGRASFFFEHSEQDGALKVSALVHRFRQSPDPALLPAFQEEQSAGTDTGGGHVEYQPESRGLFLTRVYREPPTPRSFSQEVEQLGRASVHWLDEVVARVATRTFHPQ